MTPPTSRGHCNSKEYNISFPILCHCEEGFARRSNLLLPWR